MERTKLLTFAVVGLLLINGLTLLFLVIKPGWLPHPGPPGGEGPAAVVIERLHFDARQEQQYRTLIRAHQGQTNQLNAQSVQLYRRYYALLTALRPDTAQANRLSQQIGNTQRALAEANFAHFNAINALCRPDQQADFDRLVDELSQLFGRPQRSGVGGPPENRPPRP